MVVKDLVEYLDLTKLSPLVINISYEFKFSSINLTLQGVTASLNRPKVDAVACPGVAIYNGHIKRKEKTPPFDVLPQIALRASPLNGMVIVSNYRLVEKQKKGVFRQEY